MARVKSGVVTRQRHKRILKKASGYYGKKSRLFKLAHEAVNRGLAFAFRDRKQKKRSFRSLWVARINAAAREHGGISYSSLMGSLRKQGVALDRKALADLAYLDVHGFKAIIDSVR
jgi:large subunit ribosomal protein L20